MIEGRVSFFRRPRALLVAAPLLALGCGFLGEATGAFPDVIEAGTAQADATVRRRGLRA